MDSIGVGLIGTGYMGKCHALAWNAVHAVFGDGPGVRLEHLCETTPEFATQRAAEFGFSRSGADWRAQTLSPDGSAFAVFRGEKLGEVHWTMTGRHSVNNGLAAIMAAEHAGVPPAVACKALSAFPGVKRRMEIVGEVGGITVYDDFAHHPTAIATTLEGLRRKVGSARIIAVIEPRSNTMRLGAHKDSLAPSVAAADEVLWYQPQGLNWDLGPVVAASPVAAEVLDSIDAIIAKVVASARPGDQVVIMSNGGFGGIHQKLVSELQGR